MMTLLDLFQENHPKSGHKQEKRLLTGRFRPSLYILSMCRVGTTCLVKGEIKFHSFLPKLLSFNGYSQRKRVDSHHRFSRYQEVTESMSDSLPSFTQDEHHCCHCLFTKVAMKITGDI